ncbi:ribose-5-phosphate isomerase A [Streptomyces sp. NPDC005492]|uniref:ribose-5-phosphate isomerase A n=1 Tax=Streptomyces sp. NPDC005492 TaxID=3156883 RepID=UPI0033A1ADB8
MATPTSDVIADRARDAGIELVPVQGSYDFYLDGADQVAPTGDVVKGSWGAHVREKTLAELSARRVLICDESKLVDKLVGPVPVAIVPYFGGLYAPESADVKTDDNGLTIVAMSPGEVIDAPGAWNEEICCKPGVVMTGIFPVGFVEQIIVGCEDGSHRIILTKSNGA